VKAGLILARGRIRTLGRAGLVVQSHLAIAAGRVAAVGGAEVMALRGPRTDGPMAPEISLDNQRPAQYIFSDQVQLRLSEIRAAEALEKARKSAAKAESASTAA